MAVGVSVATGVAGSVGIAVSVAAAVAVSVAVSVGIGVAVAEAVAVSVATAVSVAAGVAVPVGTGVAVGIGVAVSVATAVAVSVAIGVTVGRPASQWKLGDFVVVPLKFAPEVELTSTRSELNCDESLNGGGIGMQKLYSVASVRVIVTVDPVEMQKESLLQRSARGLA